MQENYEENKSVNSEEVKKEEVKKEEVKEEIDDNSSYEDSNSDVSDDEVEDEAEELQVTQEFQENVIMYVKLDDMIKKRQAELTALKKEKKPCEEFIIQYLDKVDFNEIEVTDGKLCKNRSEVKGSITLDVIKNSVSGATEDPTLIKKILDNIDNRPKKVNTKLKRKINRVKKDT